MADFAQFKSKQVVSAKKVEGTSVVSIATTGGVVTASPGDYLVKDGERTSSENKTIDLVKVVPGSVFEAEFEAID